MALWLGMSAHNDLVWAAALSLGLASLGCGLPAEDDSGEATPTVQPTPIVTSALYEVSSLEVRSDRCREFEGYRDGTRLSVEATSSTVSVTQFTMTLAEDGTLAGRREDDTDWRPGFDCVESSLRTYSGTLPSPDVLDWTVVVERQVVAGAECELSPSEAPCRSEASMRLTRTN